MRLNSKQTPIFRGKFRRKAPIFFRHTKDRSVSNIRTLFCTAGILSILIVLAAVGLGQSSKPSNAALQTANLLNRIFMARFQRTDDNRFGISRMLPIVSKSHDNIGFVQSPIASFTPEENEKTLYTAVQAQNRDFIIALMHTEPRTVQPIKNRLQSFRPKLIPIAVRDALRQFVPSSSIPNTAFPNGSAMRKTLDENRALITEIEANALTALPTLQRGRSLNQYDKGYLITLYPVRAESAACIRCHTTHKIGDTLASLVYIVREK